MAEVLKLLKDAADPEFEDTHQFDNLRVVLGGDAQAKPEDLVAELVQSQNDQKICLDGIMAKTKETSVKLVQNTSSLESVRTNVQTMAEKLENNAGDLVTKIEKSTLLTTLGKKVNTLTETVRSLEDKVALIPSSGAVNPTVKEFDDSKVKPNWGDGPIDILGHRDWSLKEFLQQPEGRSLHALLWTMSIPDRNDWNELVAWWDFQKTRWTKQHENNLLPWYRAVSWWASQFLNAWQMLLTEYMTNPFNLSLQEIGYKVAFLRNLLNSMGLITNKTARVKWVEPFVHMGKN